MMSFWKRLIARFTNPTDVPTERPVEVPVVAAAPARASTIVSFPDKRAHRRFNVPSKATIILSRGATQVECQILDASRNGVRVIIPDHVAHEPIIGFSFFFNGYTLVSRVGIAWARDGAQGCEMGLNFRARECDSHLFDLFENYFCWREGRAA